jgi:hypothetical protein
MTKLSSEKPEIFKGRHFNHLPSYHSGRADEGLLFLHRSSDSSTPREQT